jgi:uncharacterized protein YdeI (YjbR/CyaY-like superfamily)
MSPLIFREAFLLLVRSSLRKLEVIQPMDQCRLSPTFGALRIVGFVMEIGETLYVTKPPQFYKWLKKNHAAKKEIWLVQYKKATHKPSINYVEAVEVAICFGWIDGLEKGMDTERYATRFSPRRPKSNWTETNKERARKMIERGLMTPSGLAAVPADVLQSS